MDGDDVFCERCGREVAIPYLWDKTAFCCEECMNQYKRIYYDWITIARNNKPEEPDNV